MSENEGHNPVDIEDQDGRRLKSEAEDAVARQRELDDLHWLMRHKVGRRIVWRVLEGAGIYRTSFRAEALQTAFLEGRRNGGLEMLHEIINACPELYNTMLAENRHG